MSVVAWDGKTLAADRQATCAGLRTPTSKMCVTKSEIIAWTGDSDKGRLLADWYLSGADKTTWPKQQEDKDGWVRMIVASASGCKVYEMTPYPLIVHAPFAAWGSGRDYAYGALEMGADARRAVEVANIHSIECGFGVEAYDLEELK